MKVVEIARSYIGQLEKPGNSGFKDPSFESDMIKFGEWQKGFSWCCCFASMCFRKAFPERDSELRKLFDPSTRKTLENFKAAKYKITSSPVLGALVIWGLYEGGKLSWKGHAGIVSDVIDKYHFKSVEGNTSGGGSRNGDRVFEHSRNTLPKSNGLNVLGFVVI